MGQHVKQGCFDTFQLSCDSNLEDTADGLNVVFLEDTCHRFIDCDVFPVQEIFMDPTLHAKDLNGFDSTSDDCSQFWDACPSVFVLQTPKGMIQELGMNVS